MPNIARNVKRMMRSASRSAVPVISTRPRFGLLFDSRLLFTVMPNRSSSSGNTGAAQDSSLPPGEPCEVDPASTWST